MAGYLLIKNNQAIAIQILFFSKSVNYLSVEFINAGIDMKNSQKSWLKYSNTIFKGIKFLSKFKSQKEFEEIPL